MVASFITLRHPNTDSFRGILCIWGAFLTIQGLIPSPISVLSTHPIGMVHILAGEAGSVIVGGSSYQDEPI